jgi:thiol-disulfide isomerase/thioredoxin
MKKITLFLMICTLVINGCRTSKPAAQEKPSAPVQAEPAPKVAPVANNFSDPSTFLLGYFKVERLSGEPYAQWFKTGYDDYQFNSTAINKLLDIKNDNLKIKIVMGTWCPDSRREVPRLIRVLDLWKFPASQIEFIGVDKTKKSEIADYESLKIERVPTVIIYKNNIEAGRIIEFPETSLEQDIFIILSRNE